MQPSDARDLMQRLLQLAGATVSMASSASEAMERILAERPEVLVCDIGMPGEDGYTLAVVSSLAGRKGTPAYDFD